MEVLLECSKTYVQVQGVDSVRPKTGVVGR